MHNEVFSGGETTLPAFNAEGDLPEGIHFATIERVIVRFGSATSQRQDVTQRLRRIFDLAKATGRLHRFLIFGSYVTAKPEPNDVDVFLIMSADFDKADTSGITYEIFAHSEAHNRLSATVFWITLQTPQELIEAMLEGWQITRQKTRRGIVEVQL